jgi:amino acid transporter
MGTAVVVGTVIGSGVFYKPQVVAENVPYFGLAAFVWIMGGLLALFGALSLSEVAVLYPHAGGNYVYLREGYGRMAGFLFGWVEFSIIRSASLAALATIFADSLRDILRNEAFQQATGWHLGTDPLGFWSHKVLITIVILGLALVNVLGVRWGGLLQLLITLVKVASLVGIAVLPFVMVWLVQPGSQVPRPQTQNLVPVWPDWNALDLGKLGTAMVGVLWAYHGWMNIAPVAEEIRHPQRNIPISFLAGVGIIILLYLGANLGYCLVIPQDQMALMKEPDPGVATQYSLRLLGNIGGAVASAAIMCSVFGALNGNLLVGPRLLYAMGEDGLAPEALRTVHPRFRTPAWAILVLALWSVLLIGGGALLTRFGPPEVVWAGVKIELNKEVSLFNLMTDFAIFGSVLFETLAVSTIFVFRRRLPQVERPYRCWGYPIVPLLYVTILALVAVNMFRKQQTASLVGVALIAVGACVYFLWGRKSSAVKPKQMKASIPPDQV